MFMELILPLKESLAAKTLRTSYLENETLHLTVNHQISKDC